MSEKASPPDAAASTAPPEDGALARTDPGVDPDPWSAWRRFTNARIALGRTGHALPTGPLLDFKLAHAQARDAVHHPLDVAALTQALSSRGHEVVAVRSAAADRADYLRRPDLGRRLAADSRDQLLPPPATPVELLFVIADGLSATAAGRQAVPLLDALLPRLNDWSVGPLVIATQARVALGDEIASLWRARFVVMLIGERPGLSSPDSLGIYLTHAPQVGCRDADRNCISNVRPEGLGYAAAAHKLHHLLTQARRLGLTGVTLKDDSDGMLEHQP
ncbi:ethanolamine ammonia-lyase subunit EutC [Roseateles amylovorans]|uniref:Ethanolamine ammonia-lyase small subunit n=1 Tax=Roseateles amylovorans TaxID=2978473 RepID=A0ABY6B251_9BURK|nr:ethanolamine ammonia-lyase subunit EutC [Roseateles amylovorans]UXH79151.1 ethanolamine ammonia-lyase subunit EutC [Roseateles amylovorans]